MKEVEGFKNVFYVHKGIYDNRVIYENTLESIQKALNLNKGIVLDILITKDNQLIVYSEINLTNYNVKDKIIDATYEDICYLCPQHILLFSECLEVINGKVPILINPLTISKNQVINKEIAKCLDNYSGRFAIINEDAINIIWYNKFRPNYITGEILTKHKTNIYSFANVIANFSIVTDFKLLDINYYDIRKIQELKNKHMLIGYPINSEENVAIYKDYFDSLITNIVE